MYFWQKTGFKIGIGVIIVAAVVSVTLFSEQIDNLLEMFGSKAGVSQSVIWGDFPFLWNYGNYELAGSTCFIDSNDKLTLCNPSDDGDGTDSDDEIDPGETDLEETITEPEVTEPEVTEPEVTEPEVTEPEVTEPEVTDPDETDSDEIDSGETDSDGADLGGITTPSGLGGTSN